MWFKTYTSLFLSSTKYNRYKIYYVHNMPSCLRINVTINVNILNLMNNDVFVGLWECSHPQEQEGVAEHQKPPRDQWPPRPYPPRHPQQPHPSLQRRGPLLHGRPSAWVTCRTSCLLWMVSNDWSSILIFYTVLSRFVVFNTWRSNLFSVPSGPSKDRKYYKIWSLLQYATQ